ncbi:MAG TPA: DUF4142 domain-containing protein [Bacteroidia bacterium]|nr:DUF4142 domain-containing protein [Bacteroidia bacterium]
MKNTLLLLSLAAVLVAAPACENKKANNEQNDADGKEMAKDQNEQKFDETSLEKDAEMAVKIADAGLYEVRVSELAQTKATNADVKEFAMMMVKDHTMANEELKAWAARKNVSLPSAMSEDMQKKYNDLNEEKGMDFDKEYMDMMVKDHDKDIEMFEKCAEDCKDAELKTWCNEKLTTLRMHKDHAEKIQEKVKDAKKSAKR